MGGDCYDIGTPEQYEEVCRMANDMKL
jgi:hypothetical protein